MKLKCDVCGKEVKVTDQLKGVTRSTRWLAVRSKGDNVLHKLVCGGGLFVDGVEHDKCLSVYLKEKSEAFREAVIIEVFFPVEKLVPKDCVSTGEE
jgi:hypothetical protein